MIGPARSDGSTAARERCPTCGAVRRGGDVCHRCKSDLGLFLQLERRVDELRAQARRCYARGWYRQAAALASRIVSLERTPPDLALLACASLMAGDFPTATAAYRQTRRPTCDETDGS